MPLNPWVYPLTGQLDIALSSGHHQVIGRLRILRSRLTAPDSKLMQIVTTPASVPLAQVSCTTAELAAEVMPDRRRATRPRRDTVRPWLICLSPNEFVLVISFITRRRRLGRWTSSSANSRTCTPAESWAERLVCGRCRCSWRFRDRQRAARIDPTDLAYGANDESRRRGSRFRRTVLGPRSTAPWRAAAL